MSQVDTSYMIYIGVNSNFHSILPYFRHTQLLYSEQLLFHTPLIRNLKFGDVPLLGLVQVIMLGAAKNEDSSLAMHVIWSN